MYIVTHRNTVSLYNNSSVWLDTRDAFSRISYRTAISNLNVSEGI